MALTLATLLAAVAAVWLSSSSSSSSMAAQPGYSLNTSLDVNLTNSAPAEELLQCNLTLPASFVAPTVSCFWELDGQKIADSGSEVAVTESKVIVSEYKIIKPKAEHAGVYTCVFETIPESRANITVISSPEVTTHKKSENHGEGDTADLVCRCYGYPAVTWSWLFKPRDGKEPSMPVINGSRDGRLAITSAGEQTQLSLRELAVAADGGDYTCLAHNGEGVSSHTILLRVRSRLAALWPFLGIVAEVVILIAIIFVYEKRKQPDDVPDDDDPAPLKSNSTNNHKEKVRQRNTN